MRQAARFLRFSLILLSALSLTLPSLASAQAVTGKPITIIVPFATGGTTDIVARLVGQQLGLQLSVPVIVDNRLGGGGVVGRTAAAKAPADGQTLLAMDMSYATAAGLTPDLPYDPKNAFVPIIMAASVPHILVVNPKVPANNLKELIALAKAHPDQLNFGSGGIGTNTHLGAELFKSIVGVQVMHVPYKGAGAVLADLMAGQVQMLVSAAPTVLPYIQSGKLRPIALFSDTRLPALPNVPTVVEAGFPGMTMDFWVAFAVPKNTPPETIARLNRAIDAGLSTPEATKILTDMGLSKAGGTPEETARTVYGEIDRWAALIKQQGIKPE